MMTLEKQPYNALSIHFFQEIFNFSNLIEQKISTMQALNEPHSQWFIFEDYFQETKLTILIILIILDIYPNVKSYTVEHLTFMLNTELYTICNLYRNSSI